MLKKLKSGDCIGIISPSSPITYNNYEQFISAKNYITDKGFRIIEGTLTGKFDHYRSGTIKARADELNELINNKDVKCIMAAGGGWVSNSILPYIDYEAFIRNPKIVVGFSDITAIILGIYAVTGIHTFYGSDLISFGETQPFNDYNYKFFSNILVDVQKPHYNFEIPPLWAGRTSNKANREIHESNEWITVSGGCAKGRLIGGNLNTITGIWGSRYMPEIMEGDILLLEDVAKNASITERSFSLLKLNGVFDRVKGIILGKHDGFDDEGTGRKPYEILLEVLGHTNIPILSEFDCSHTEPHFTLPIGAEIELDATNKNVILTGSWIE